MLTDCQSFFDNQHIYNLKLIAVKSIDRCRENIRYKFLDGWLSNAGLTISLPMTANTKTTIFAQGTVTASDVAIRTSTLSDLETSLRSSVNPIDLPVLLFGGTVKTLVMKNVNLKINRYLQAQSQDLPNFHLLVSSTTNT